MLQNQQIDNLKQEAKADPALDATLTMFGMRERARKQVTVRALKQRMEAEGWQGFDEHDYQRVLKALAKHGVGKLEVDGKGRVQALKEIRVTLQSLGQAVCDGVRRSIDKFAPRNTYVAVKPPVAPPAPAPKAPPQRRASDKVIAVADSITVNYKGKPVIVNVPEGFSAQEIAEFLVNMRSWK